VGVTRPLILPVGPIPAGDEKVKVNGRSLEIPHRIIAEETYQELLNLLCLADRTIVDLVGAYPLHGHPMHQAMNAIRTGVTGRFEFEDRRERAAKALGH
jgi:hypothetical protein